MERIGPSEGHSHPGERRRIGQVRSWKGLDRARGTHILESADGWDKSGHGKDWTERGALTSWRAQTDRTSQVMERIGPSEGHSHPGERRRMGQVRSWKGLDRARGTHILESADGWDKSGHGKDWTERGALTSWRAQTDGTSQVMERIGPSEGHSHPGERRR